MSDTDKTTESALHDDAAPVAPAADVAAEATQADGPEAEIAALEAKLKAATDESHRLTAELRAARQPAADTDAMRADLVEKLVAELDRLPEKVVRLLDEESAVRRAQSTEGKVATRAEDAPPATESKAAGAKGKTPWGHNWLGR